MRKSQSIIYKTVDELSARIAKETNKRWLLDMMDSLYSLASLSDKMGDDFERVAKLQRLGNACYSRLEELGAYADKSTEVKVW